MATDDYLPMAGEMPNVDLGYLVMPATGSTGHKGAVAAGAPGSRHERP
jgi:hypothetical protein